MAPRPAGRGKGRGGDGRGVVGMGGAGRGGMGVAGQDGRGGRGGRGGVNDPGSVTQPLAGKHKHEVRGCSAPASQHNRRVTGFSPMSRQSDGVSDKSAFVMLILSDLLKNRDTGILQPFLPRLGPLVIAVHFQSGGDEGCRFLLTITPSLVALAGVALI